MSFLQVDYTDFLAVRLLPKRDGKIEEAVYIPRQCQKKNSYRWKHLKS